MSLRNNNSSSTYLTRAISGTDLPSLTSAHTVMCWVWLTTNTTRSAIWSMQDVGESVYHGFGNMGTENVNDFFIFANGDYDQKTDLAASVTTWYHIALSQSASNARTCWVHNASGTLLWTLTSAVTLAGTISDWRLFARPDAWWHDGRIADLKVWSRALSLAEVQAERPVAAAVSTTNFWGGWYFQTIATINAAIPGGSGSGGNWTITGAGLLDEADPPIAFGGGTTLLPNVGEALGVKDMDRKKVS